MPLMCSQLSLEFEAQVARKVECFDIYIVHVLKKK